jgi:septal ring-binding cell division protein DamX
MMGLVAMGLPSSVPDQVAVPAMPIPVGAAPASKGATPAKPPAAQQAKPGVPSRGAAAGAHPTSAQVGAGAPRPRSATEARIDGFVETRTNLVADEVGDQAGDVFDSAAAPVLDGAVGALGSVMPSFLSAQLPWVADRARMHGRTAVARSVEDGVEDGIRGGVSASKESVLGDPAAESTGEVALQGSAQGSAQGSPQAFGASAAVPSSGAVSLATSRRVLTIEIARFATQRNAETFTGDIARRGLDARVVIDPGPDGRPWHSIRTGRYGTQAEATEALQRLRAGGFGGTVVSQNSPGGIP